MEMRFGMDSKSSASIARPPSVRTSVLGIALSIRYSSPTMSPWGAWPRRWTINRWQLLLLLWMCLALVSKGLAWREVSP